LDADDAGKPKKDVNQRKKEVPLEEERPRAGSGGKVGDHGKPDDTGGSNHEPVVKNFAKKGKGAWDR